MWQAQTCCVVNNGLRGQRVQSEDLAVHAALRLQSPEQTTGRGEVSRVEAQCRPALAGTVGGCLSLSTVRCHGGYAGMWARRRLSTGIPAAMTLVPTAGGAARVTSTLLRGSFCVHLDACASVFTNGPRCTVINSLPSWCTKWLAATNVSIQV
jgi:hypothetical protein